MGDKSLIEWTDATWNPTSGCTKKSPGCKLCYAKVLFPRVYGSERKFEQVLMHEHRLDQPLRWTRPRRIFVNSMSDLFHEHIPFEFVDRVFEVMRQCPQHTFQILTKRDLRMREYFNFDLRRPVLPNVWLGVSVENQDAADERILNLIETRAAKRFLSCEPLIGPVSIEQWLWLRSWNGDGSPGVNRRSHAIDWVIVGGESGRGARPMHPEWARTLRDECQKSGTKFFFKQWGEYRPARLDDDATLWMDTKGRQLSVDAALKFMSSWKQQHGQRMIRVGKKNAGRLLDCRTWDELPA